MNGKTIAKKMHRIENAILGALGNLEILNKLKDFGYTTERIIEGKRLWDEANQLIIVQVREYGEQYAATNEQEKYREEIYAQYMVVVKITRVALKKQPDMLARFGVVGERPRSLSGWLRSARIFYTNLLETPNALEIMGEFGVTAQQLQDGLQNIEKIESLHVRQLSEKSAAQQSTQARDKAFDELCNWYSDFRAIARIALYNDPQLLEALDIVKK